MGWSGCGIGLKGRNKRRCVEIRLKKGAKEDVVLEEGSKNIQGGVELIYKIIM